MGLLAVGMAERKWSDLQRIQGLNTYERQLLLRLKSGKTLLWNTHDTTNTTTHRQTISNLSQWLVGALTKT